MFMIHNAKYGKKENYFSSYDREDHKMSQSKGNVLTYVKCSITGQKAQGRAKGKADMPVVIPWIFTSGDRDFRATFCFPSEENFCNFTSIIPTFQIFLYFSGPLVWKGQTKHSKGTDWMEVLDPLSCTRLVIAMTFFQGNTAWVCKHDWVRQKI